MNQEFSFRYDSCGYGSATIRIKIDSKEIKKLGGIIPENNEVLLHAETTFSGPFWNGGCEIGRYDGFEVDGQFFVVNFSGFKEWYLQADQLFGSFVKPQY